MKTLFGSRFGSRHHFADSPGPVTRHTSLLGALLVVVFFLPTSSGPFVLSHALATFHDARSTAASPLPASLSWAWPLAGKPQVLHPFAPPAKPWLSGHRGVDFAAPQGTVVYAPTSGVVTFSQIVVNRPVLTIAVENGLRLSFEPVTSTLRVGERVAQGQTIGIVEGPSHCDGAAAGTGINSCLHWGVRRGQEYLDPLQFILDLRPSILLPLND